ncbi:M20/M25/M40 family metallo-hydrolase [bacterium]|nr:M20/M25/M40 family metallo-hydrolase [bacterium]
MGCLQLTRTLIDIPSVTGHEERIGDFLKGYLSAAGFHIVKIPVDTNRFNIFASIGKPNIVYSTHMDTVPPYFPASEDSENIYGRGACDAKGIMASQIQAAIELKQEGESDFALLFVVGEERGSDGALAANHVANSCRFLINGEPTDNYLATGTKGVYRGKILTTGKAAHAAYPEMGSSAIFKLIDIIEKIRNMAWPSNAQLGETIFNVGTIKGGVTANVVPDTAEAEIMFRIVESVKDMDSRLAEILEDNAIFNSDYTCDPVHLFTVDGFMQKSVSFATDITSLTKWGRPLLIGPGSILYAHSPDERIRKNQILEAVTAYKTLYHKLKVL